MCAVVCVYSGRARTTELTVTGGRWFLSEGGVSLVLGRRYLLKGERENDVHLPITQKQAARTQVKQE